MRKLQVERILPRSIELRASADDRRLRLRQVELGEQPAEFGFVLHALQRGELRQRQPDVRRERIAKSAQQINLLVRRQQHVVSAAAQRAHQKSKKLVPAAFENDGEGRNGEHRSKIDTGTAGPGRARRFRDAGPTGKASAAPKGLLPR